MVRPSALAVLRLITNSNFAGCSTGRSPGLARRPRASSSLIVTEWSSVFFQEHQYCGELDGGVEGDRVWMTCTGEAVIVRM
jgi:hypothetical protein